MKRVHVAPHGLGFELERTGESDTPPVGDILEDRPSGRGTHFQRSDVANRDRRFGLVQEFGWHGGGASRSYSRFPEP